MKNNIFKRVLCSLLCLCMMAGTLLTLASCGEKPEEPTEGYVNVVKVVKDIPAGTVIKGDMVTTEEILVSNVHINAIRSLSKVKGKVALQDMYAGELVFAGKLGEPKEETEEDLKSKNLVVTEHIEITEDVTEALQKLIDDNPGRTIEFPDGEYIISKPLTIPADPAKAVSLRLSDYAVIRAADYWESEDAMIQFAVGEIPADSAVASFYINGGIIDGNHVAKALCIQNAKGVLVANVNLANTMLGLEIVSGQADAENIIITGTDTEESLGMQLSGDDCTVVNIRINNVFDGVKVDGNNNVLKSVYAVCADNSKETCGYYDTGSNSIYDMCMSEQFSTAFRMGADSICTYSACAVKWTSAANKQHRAFSSDKKFNSLIRNCKVEFDFEVSGASFLTVGDVGGNGQIIYPIIGGKDNMKSNAFKNYLVDYGNEEEPVIYIENK